MSMNPPSGLRGMYQGALQAGQPQGQAPLPRTPEMENPTTQISEKGQPTFFLDPSMLPQGHQCKTGDELNLRVKVGQIGSKIALTPIEVLPLNDPNEASELDGTSEAEAE